jgi:hypothetical protein
MGVCCRSSISNWLDQCLMPPTSQRAAVPMPNIMTPKYLNNFRSTILTLARDFSSPPPPPPPIWPSSRDHIAGYIALGLSDCP